jgi:hypothetical protein
MLCFHGKMVSLRKARAAALLCGQRHKHESSTFLSLRKDATNESSHGTPFCDACNRFTISGRGTLEFGV